MPVATAHVSDAYHQGHVTFEPSPQVPLSQDAERDFAPFTPPLPMWGEGTGGEDHAGYWQT
ncbi:MAG: hypothetical protein AAGG53_04995 [Cyanobacteria bacterium P01_H01_bin.152]